MASARSVTCQARRWQGNVAAAGRLGCHSGFSASPGSRNQTPAWKEDEIYKMLSQRWVHRASEKPEARSGSSRSMRGVWSLIRKGSGPRCNSLCCCALPFAIQEADREQQTQTGKPKPCTWCCVSAALVPAPCPIGAAPMVCPVPKLAPGSSDELLLSFTRMLSASPTDTLLIACCWRPAGLGERKCCCRRSWLKGGCGKRAGPWCLAGARTPNVEP